MFEYFPLLFIFFLGSVISIGAIVAGKILGFRSKDTKNKFSPYECGVEAFGNARIRFKAGYYVFALLFLLFDIEALFLIPILASLKSILGDEATISSFVIVVDILFFVCVLISGLAYSWKKGYLQWE